MKRNRLPPRASALLLVALLWVLGFAPAPAPDGYLGWRIASAGAAEGDAPQQPEKTAETSGAMAEPPAAEAQPPGAATGGAETPGEKPAAASPAQEVREEPARPKPPAAPPPTQAADSAEETLGWARDFRTWEPVTGYVPSNSHGNRLVRTYVSPLQAVKVFNGNAERVTLGLGKGFLAYLPGTIIAQESWVRNAAGGPGRPGPLFFMRKEDPGFDPQTNDWQFAFTRADRSVIAAGDHKDLAFCKECHATVRERDMVFATQR